MNFAEILESTLKPDLRVEAEKQLNFLSNQSFELSNHENQTHIRQAAGLALKNTISSRDPNIKAKMEERWNSTDVGIRQKIKEQLLETLGTSDLRAGATASQVVQAVAEIELASGRWPELVPYILSKASSESDQNTRITTLKTLGLICETCVCSLFLNKFMFLTFIKSCPELLEYTNAILTCVASAITQDSVSTQVHLAGMSAFFNSLEFVCGNFYVDQERNFIMSMACDATLSDDPAIKIIAYECLVKIVTYYYSFMEPYMETALIPITFEGMKASDESVVIQAIEFWSTVCEKEAGIVGDISLGNLNNEGKQNYEFATAAAPQLLEVLWPLMEKTDENEDDDEWSVHMASSTCLSLLALAVKDKIVNPVSYLIEQNIISTNWTQKEAAITALGSIVCGPGPNCLNDIVVFSSKYIFEVLETGNPTLKTTASWALGRILENLPFFITQDVLPVLVNSILKLLEGSPRIVSNGTWCLICLAEYFGAAQGEEASPLSQYFQLCVSRLMYVGSHVNLDPNLRASVFEAVSTFVAKSHPNCKELVMNLLLGIIREMEAVVSGLESPNAKDENQFQYDYLGNICAVIASIARRLRKDIGPVFGKLVDLLLYILNKSGDNSSIKEDVFLAVSALSNSIDFSNVKCLNVFMGPLLSCLQNYQDHQLCVVSIGLLGDMCRALEKDIAPVCDNIMNILLQNLQQPDIDTNVKFATLSILGDIALAIGTDFSKYSSIVMDILNHHSQLCFVSGVVTMCDYEYLNQLRANIIDAYTGIIQGLKEENKMPLSRPQIIPIFSFIQRLIECQDRDPQLIVDIIGLIGDLADALPCTGEFKEFFSQPWLKKFLNVSGISQNLSVEGRKIAAWAYKKANAHCT